MCAVSSHEKVQRPSMLARLVTLGASLAVFAVWWRCTFVPEEETPAGNIPIHSFWIPLVFTTAYLISLPILRYIVETLVPKSYDIKGLILESMLLYNSAQVLLNGWMVWKFIYAISKGHPFVGDIYTTSFGTTYAMWVHYCDKYLEFFDTYFMVIRGRHDQVSFLHVYHHFSIVWAWWAALKFFPGGDSYFGALFNSSIHVLMYGYYSLALLKIPCPWKRYLTQAQLLQFFSVIIYSIYSVFLWPKNQKQNNHFIALYVQLWEMTSLFILFYLFYKKSYGRTKKVED